MSEAAVETLFDEFATRYLRGERPDVREYLERAGAEREELGRMLDRFLQAVPARAPSEEDTVLMQARLEQEPPLLLLRLRRKLTRAAVVDAIVTRLGLDPGRKDKVGDYYHRLEVGTLDPEGVDRSVWDVLAGVFQANARALAGARPEPPPAPAAAYLREPTGLLASLDRVAPGAPAPEDREEPDEVDRLFLGGGGP